MVRVLAGVLVATSVIGGRRLGGLLLCVSWFVILHYVYFFMLV